MIEIKLPCYGITITLDNDDDCGTISSDLHEDYTEDHPDKADIMQYNCMMDAIESILLAHACAGIDVETLPYIEGIETAVQACASQTA